MKICDQTQRNQCDDSAVLIGVYLTETQNMFNRKDKGFFKIKIRNFRQYFLVLLIRMTLSRLFHDSNILVDAVLAQYR